MLKFRNLTAQLKSNLFSNNITVDVTSKNLNTLENYFDKINVTNNQDNNTLFAKTTTPIKVTVSSNNYNLLRLKLNKLLQNGTENTHQINSFINSLDQDQFINITIQLFSFDNATAETGIKKLTFAPENNGLEKGDYNDKEYYKYIILEHIAYIKNLKSLCKSIHDRLDTQTLTKINTLLPNQGNFHLPIIKYVKHNIEILEAIDRANKIELNDLNKVARSSRNPDQFKQIIDQNIQETLCLIHDLKGNIDHYFNTDSPSLASELGKDFVSSSQPLTKTICDGNTSKFAETTSITGLVTSLIVRNEKNLGAGVDDSQRQILGLKKQWLLLLLKKYFRLCAINKCSSQISSAEIKVIKKFLNLKLSGKVYDVVVRKTNSCQIFETLLKHDHPSNTINNETPKVQGNQTEINIKSQVKKFVVAKNFKELQNFIEKLNDVEKSCLPNIVFKNNKFRGNLLSHISKAISSANNQINYECLKGLKANLLKISLDHPDIKKLSNLKYEWWYSTFKNFKLTDKCIDLARIQNYLIAVMNSPYAQV